MICRSNRRYICSCFFFNKNVKLSGAVAGVVDDNVGINENS